MNEKFILFREKYSKIIYKKYQIVDEEEVLKIVFTFEIPNLTTFEPTLSIQKKIL